MIQPPKQPSGSSKRASWLRSLVAFARSCRILEGNNITTEVTPEGTRIHSKLGTGITFRWTKICVDGEEKWARVARSIVYDELPPGVEEPTE